MKRNVFSDKNFTLYFLGMFVTGIGNVFYNFAISWYILELTGSASQAGMYLAVGSLVTLVLANFGAALVDRMDKVKIMYVTDFLSGIVVLTASYVIFNVTNVSIILITLYVVRIFLAIFSALFSPATQTLVKYMVPEENLQQANSYLQIRGTLQSIIGMALAGVVYSQFGIGNIFVLNAITFILSGISELFIKVDTQEKLENETTFNQILIDIKTGWVYVMRKKSGIFKLMLIALFINFPFALLFATGIPYLFNQELGVDPSYLSSMNVAMSIGAIAMMVYLSTKSIPEKVYGNLRKYMTILVILMIVILYNIYSMYSYDFKFTYVYLTLVGIMFVFSMVSAALNVPMQTYFTREFDKEMFARSMVVLGIMSELSFPFAAALGGFIIDGLGLTTLLVVSGIILILSFSWFITDKQIKKI